MSLGNKTILITGGVGSFGQEFAKIILKECNPKSVRIYDNRELAQVEMEREIKDPRLRFFIGDIRDTNRLHRAFNGVDIVVHAAALKHVPICEYNPIEAIKTNIDGTVNVIDGAINNGVQKAILISTDKAVQPVNLYGATKMVAEKLFVQGNSYSGDRKTMFSVARYGNVIGSSGSVVPLFQKQKEMGEITITDETMTRFWITLDQGVRFVVKCIENMKGGEIFIPKIPSTKITDLAEAIAPGVKRKIIGIRPGEKIHEVLLTAEESRNAKEFEEYFIITPEFSFWDTKNHQDGKETVDKFLYSSDSNTKWLDKEQIKHLIT
ncbi:MAG: UDP-N-acetylglucosamine 4,6-dehydratase (inverting) [Candidatus Staskawiczbacteria bacterium]|nr:UDP-N-acetylglucosamine 4,6-dehydratase (inverting) [Candidatus Staskawiczbacteria bacterium]MBI3337258.1 UDP-N-acetylglucosamine 4,6-dehydratase (inverting) [Candidatus Staskawiczbacteria bacterium]